MGIDINCIDLIDLCFQAAVKLKCAAPTRNFEFRVPETCHLQAVHRIWNLGAINI